MRRWPALLIAGLLIAGLLIAGLLRAGPALAQMGPEGPPAGFQFLNTWSLASSGQTVALPAGVNLLQVQFRNLAWMSTSSLAYIDVVAVTSGGSNITLIRRRPADEFNSAYLRLPAGTASVRVSYGSSVSGGQVDVFTRVQPDTPFATAPFAAQCTNRVLNATEYLGQTITISQTGVILIGRVMATANYRTTYYASSPGPLVYDGFIPRISTSTFYGEYNTLGPLPAGTYTIVTGTELSGVMVAAYHCSGVAVPTPTLSPLNMTATAAGATATAAANVTATALAATATALAATPTATATPTPLIRVTPLVVTPVLPVVQDVDFGVVQQPEQCTQVVPPVSIGIPNTDVQFGWDGFTVCTRRFAFSIKYGTVDLVPIVLGALAFAALWSIWTVIRRG